MGGFSYLATKGPRFGGYCSRKTFIYDLNLILAIFHNANNTLLTMFYDS